MARINRRLLSKAHIDASKASSLGIPSLTAATTPVSLGGNTRKTTSNQKNTGAATAWEYYDTVGELSYVCRWLGNNLSQVKLMASDLDENGDPLGSTEDSTAAKIVADIAGGPAGQAQLLSRLATFLTVPGEGWVAVITRKDDDGNLGQEWHVLSSEEISHKGNQIVMELGDGDNYTLNPSTDILTRVYHPHPRRSREATSPTRVAIPILKEIQRTTATIDGAAKSRLAGNGILAIPSEVSMPVQAAPSSSKDAPGLPTPTPADSPTYDRKVSASDVSAQLQQVMTMAIQDPASAAALVPIVLQAPGEQIDNIRHITFESDITDTALNTRDKAMLRLARTLDVPQEVLLGTADANHWSAWQIDEAGIKSHIAPMMTVICDALTDAILRPLLKTQGHADPSKVVVWFDTTKLTQRPNRSQDAKDAFAAGVLSDDKFREALGFTEDDAPPTDLSEEQLRSMAIQMVTKAPSLYPQLAEFIGFPAPNIQQVQQSQQIASPGSTPAGDPVRETHTPPGGTE